jgi:hypothetical protein
VLQGRFLDPAGSGLKAQVREGENDLPAFDLK